MPRHSAGILLYRRRGRSGIEVLLVHPGGPFWAKKDEGAWSIPKGEYAEGEDAFEAAKRELAEETGADITAIMKGDAIALGAFRQSSAKIVDVWAIEGDFDPATLKSNTFSMPWPPRSGRMIEVPEVDRGEWFTPGQAQGKMLKGQRAIVETLVQRLERDRFAGKHSSFHAKRESPSKRKR